MAASSIDRSVGCASGGESACSTPPFVSAPSSPARDPSFSAAAGCFFYSAPASPSAADEYGREQLGFDFDFDFSSRCPSPAAAAMSMSSADELFHNGQIRPMRLASLLLRPQGLLPPPLDGDVVPAGNGNPLPPPQQPPPEPADERGGRLRTRSVRRRYRSLSPFRAAARWLSPSSSPAPAAAKSVEPGEAAPSASRSSSSSSSTASPSSSSSRSYRRWGFFFKDILRRSRSDGGEHERPPLPPSTPSPPPPAPPKRNSSPSPVASRGRERAARRSAHARLYEARRAEAEEMRRRTFLPYRQGILLGCLGLGSRGYGAMHGGLAAAAAKSRP